MFKLPFRCSIRTRIVLASLLVEGLMLAVLVSNSLRLIQEHLIRQTENRIQAIELAYKTAVTVPLVSRDYATLRDILDGWRQADDIRYIAVTDPQGKTLAANGWNSHQPLPVASSAIDDSGIHHVLIRVENYGQNLGTIHYGLDLDFLNHARQDLFVQGSLIALSEIFMSFVLLSLIGYWLTRQLVLVSEASTQIAAGNYEYELPVSGEDEVARLADNFNTMSRSIASRIHALRKSEGRQRVLLEGLGEGVYGVDLKGKCTFINHAALEMLGYDEQAILGQDQHRLIHHQHKDGSHYAHEECPIAKTMRDGVARRVEDFLWQKDGRGFPALLSVTALVENGKIEGAIVVFVDLRAQYETTESLLNAKLAAEEASHAKSRFLANMSHEIRTPLNGVIGMAQILGMTELDSDQREYVGAIRESATGLLSIVNDILDLSKIEAGKIVLEEMAFDPGALCDNLVVLFGTQASQKGVILKTEIEHQAFQPMVGDMVRIRQILSNLLSNAIKFTQEGEVVLTMNQRVNSTDTGILEFEVEDSGIGMSEDTVQRLFSPFYQADASTTRKFGGTGLGLSICRRLTELMGGAISVHSEEGKGSRFVVTLPLQMADQNL